MTRPSFSTWNKLPASVLSWIRTKNTKNTRRTYRFRIEKLLQRLPEERRATPEAATRDEILEAADDYREEEPSIETWNCTVAAWRSFFDWCHIVGMIPENPAPPSVLKNRRREDIVQPTPTHEEIMAVWDLLLDADLWNRSDEEGRRVIQRDRAWFALVVGCALRAQETVDVRVRDIDLAAETVTVKRKAGVRARLPLAENCVDYVRPMVVGRHRDDWLLKIGNDGFEFNYQALRRACFRLMAGALDEERAKVYTPHSLRRYAATRAIQRTGNIEAVRAYMGHANVATTQLYDAARKVVPRLGEVPPLKEVDGHDS